MGDSKLSSDDEIKCAVHEIASGDKKKRRRNKQSNIRNFFDIPLLQNKRFQRSIYAGMSIMLGLSGWLIFIFEFIEYDPPVSAWIPGFMSTLGFVALNIGYFPDPEQDTYSSFSLDTMYNDGRMSPFEMFFVGALAWTLFPVIISVFILAIDYKDQSKHTVAVSLFFQTTCILISALLLMAARSMNTRPKKRDEDSYGLF